MCVYKIRPRSHEIKKMVKLDREREREREMIMLPAEDKRRVWGSTGNAKFHEAEVEGSWRL